LRRVCSVYIHPYYLITSVLSLFILIITTLTSTVSTTDYIVIIVIALAREVGGTVLRILISVGSLNRSIYRTGVA
jgi:hypothetical protein